SFSAIDGSTRPGHLREWRWPMAGGKISRRQEQITLSKSRSPCNSSMTANTFWQRTSTAFGCWNWGLNRDASRLATAVVIQLLLNNEPENGSCIEQRNALWLRTRARCQRCGSVLSLSVSPERKPTNKQNQR